MCAQGCILMNSLMEDGNLSSRPILTSVASTVSYEAATHNKGNGNLSNGENNVNNNCYHFRFHMSGYVKKSFLYLD